MEKNKNITKLSALILIIKEEAEKLGLSNVQIMTLFEEFGFSFWNINQMEKFIKELGIEGSLISSSTISEELITYINHNIDESINNCK